MIRNANLKPNYGVPVKNTIVQSYLFKCREIINKLSNNSNIIFLRQNKGRGVAVIDRKKYTEKYVAMLNTKQFCKLDKGPTKTIKIKVQRAVKKIKDHLSTSEYQMLYPRGSAPGKFYGTAKKQNTSKWNCWWSMMYDIWWSMKNVN